MDGFRKDLIWLLIFVCLAPLAAAGPAHAGEDVYYCPMHPQIVSDKTGECPICHMRLVLREPEIISDPHAEHRESRVPEGYAPIKLSPQKQSLIGIKTAPVEKKALKRSLRAPARVAYDPELYEAQIEYLKEFRIAKGTLRNRELAFKNLQDTRWEAPRIEVAKSKLILMGMDEPSIAEMVKNAKADESLIYTKPEGHVWVFVYVSPAEAAQIQKGDRVRLEAVSTRRVYEAMVHNVGTRVDPDSRRVHVHVRMENDGTLKPEMLLNAVVESPPVEALAVPEEAVFFTGTGEIVFVDKGQGAFEPRDVKVGMKAGHEYEVLDGLAEGEKVVVNANFLLDSESRLKASIDRAAALHAGHTQEAAS